MYQRNNISHDYANRRTSVTQSNYLTYQGRGPSVDLQLHIQFLQRINEMKVQIKNLTLGGGTGGSGGDDGGIASI